MNAERRMVKVRPALDLVALTDEQVERVRALPDVAHQREARPAEGTKEEGHA